MRSEIEEFVEQLVSDNVFGTPFKGPQNKKLRTSHVPSQPKRGRKKHLLFTDMSVKGGGDNPSP